MLEITFNNRCASTYSAAAARFPYALRTSTKVTALI